MPPPIQTVSNGEGTNVYRATFSGLCALFVGIGLSRFAYTPLIPPLIINGWFQPSETVYLGAANLAGYLAGASLAWPAANKVRLAILLRTMMVLATVSFFACAYPISFLWFFIWRFMAGFAGAVLLILAAPSILPRVPLSWRGLAGGTIFAGVGLGVIAAATLVPFLLRWGLVETWYALGVLALVLTVVAWGGWCALPPRSNNRLSTSGSNRTHSSLTLKSLYLEYGLNAVGLVPHMVFLADFIARGLRQGVDVAAYYWLLFGMGALAGPMLFGHIADRIGFKLALRGSFILGAAATGLVTVSEHLAALVISSTIAGASVTGITSLTLGRMNELIPDADRRTQAWSFATIIFAICQAGAAYVFSYIFVQSGGTYHVLFVIAAGSYMLALIVDLVMALSSTPAEMRQ